MEERTVKEVRETVELLKLFVKTRKVMRLYESENEISLRLMDTLASTTSEHLRTWGPCELTVLENEMRVGEHTVFKPEERTDNLAFLLFRDGIRQLTLLPGVDRTELNDLLAAINRVSQAGSTDEDLVTIFWERDFQYIRYAAVEELSQEAGGIRIEDQLAAPQLAGEGAAAGGGVDLEDLQKPVAHLPIESCLLTEEETRQLHRQLAELDEDTSQAVAELAIDLSLLSDEDEERTKIADGFVGYLDHCLAGTDVAEYMRVVAEMLELAEKDFAGEDRIDGLTAHVVRAIGRPERVSAVLENAGPQVVADGRLRPFLERLGEPALPVLVKAYSGSAGEEVRRVVAEVVLGFGTAAVPHLLRALDAGGAVDPRLARLVLHLLRKIPEDDAVVLIERLLAVDDLALRKQAARSLGPYRDGPVGDVWLRLLDDEDEQMRVLAVTALVRGGQTAVTQHLLRQVKDERFPERSAEEKQHLMIAIGRLAREQALGWFEMVLRETDAGFFSSRYERELVRAAAFGLRAVATEQSRKLLEELAGKGGRHLKAACREALTSQEQNQ